MGLLKNGNDPLGTISVHKVQEASTKQWEQVHWSRRRSTACMGRTAPVSGTDGRHRCRNAEARARGGRGDLLDGSVRRGSYHERQHQATGVHFSCSSGELLGGNVQAPGEIDEMTTEMYLLVRVTWRAIGTLTEDQLLALTTWKTRGTTKIGECPLVQATWKTRGKTKIEKYPLVRNTRENHWNL
jgi:hypothetical protein